MPIEIRGGENATHPENVTYLVYCIDCYDISEENGDLLDRPLEIMGLEDYATFEKAKKEAETHQDSYPEHYLIITGFDAGLIAELLN